MSYYREKSKKYCCLLCGKEITEKEAEEYGNLCEECYFYESEEDLDFE